MFVQQQQQQQDRQYGPSDKYEHPSPQLVLIKGSSPYITISLPMLQQYYMNVNMKNQDYAYFQVVYSDIPMMQSLSRVLPGQYHIKLTINYEALRSGDQIQGSVNTNLIVNFYGIQNSEQMADQIRSQLIVAMGKQIEDSPNTELCRVLALIQDFQFDTLTQKFMFVIKPQSYIEFQGPSVLGDSLFTSLTCTLSLADGYTISERQAKYFSYVFGGDYSGTNWSSVFTIPNSAGKPFYMSPLYHLHMRNKNSTAQYYRGMLNDIQSVNAYCQYLPSMEVDNYIYIRGAPEASIWNTDGTSTDYAAVLPRNRPYGGQVGANYAYITDKTMPVKTSLNSLRVMKLQLTDREGNPLEFDEDYVIKFAVMFDID